MIQIKFNDKIIFFRIDGEKNLRKNFENLIFELKIFYELFAFNTPKQNDHSEKKESVLFMKARVMRIDADFSNYL